MDNLEKVLGTRVDVQEQKGVYGAIVIHPREGKIAADRDVVAVLSDWSDENADAILRNLRKDGDYYLYKKGTMRSLFGAIGARSLGNYVYNEWTRMGGMDYSDVGYDAFLINLRPSGYELAIAVFAIFPSRWTCRFFTITPGA